MTWWARCAVGKIKINMGRIKTAFSNKAKKAQDPGHQALTKMALHCGIVTLPAIGQVAVIGIQHQLGIQGIGNQALVGHSTVQAFPKVAAAHKQVFHHLSAV